MKVKVSETLLDEHSYLRLILLCILDWNGPVILTQARLQKMRESNLEINVEKLQRAIKLSVAEGTADEPSKLRTQVQTKTRRRSRP